ncbi:MAG: alpha-ketoglutaric semialdehyde dehydrogenase, partial [Flavobacteriaceae bacterium]
VSGEKFLGNSKLHHEVFGPYSMVVECENVEQLSEIISNLEGQLTGTLMASERELSENPEVIYALTDRVGRVIFNGVPTGVEICPAMLHGGPYPASTDARFTAVGSDAIKRWVRPVSYQEWPNELLPLALKNDNPLGISRKVDNVDSRISIA